MVCQRPDGRQADWLRPVAFEQGFTSFALSSVLAKSGNTHVLCTVSLDDKVPKFLVHSGKGWLTAEYRMLPSATQQRQPRQLLTLSGRTQEIQRDDIKKHIGSNI